MSFLTVLLCAGGLSYQIACGNSSPALGAIAGMAWLMVAAQAMEDRR